MRAGGLAVAVTREKTCHPHPRFLFRFCGVKLWGTGPVMDPLSELQDDLTFEDTSQALNQLKLASIDEKNWPSDEMPDFPKSGGCFRISGGPACLRREDSLAVEGRPQESKRRASSPAPGWGWEHKSYWGEDQRTRVSGRTLPAPR